MFQILIVEDDKELSQLFQKVLEKNGYQVKRASEELWKLVIDVASGKARTKSEKSGYKEIMIFKNGVIL